MARKDSFIRALVNLLATIFGLSVLGLFGYVYIHQKEIMLYGAIAAVLAGAIIVVYLVIQKRRERETVYELGDEYHQAKPAPLNVERQISSLGETGRYDVFVCHASEDKLYTEELARALKASGLRVWYDKFALTWGDDLRSSIDRGLNSSKYGIVVFSKPFLQKKKWTEYELNGIFAKEVHGQKVILPIWHNITGDDLRAYSPSLADRLAMHSDDVSAIVNEVRILVSMPPVISQA